MNPNEQLQENADATQHPVTMPSRREFLRDQAAAVGSGLAMVGGVGSATNAPDAGPPEKDAQATIPLLDVIARPDLWFYPGERVAPDEMRVTLMGTGWGSVIRPAQHGASLFVELGNGDAFLFDAGPGCIINYNALQVPMSRMNKIFLTHLHCDHTNDLPFIYAFGPAVDRFGPLEIHGPTGKSPELGTKANIGALSQYTKWHRESFAATIPIEKGYDLEIYEHDYLLNPGVAYQENGVTIKHFPALHIIDGAVSYKLEWNGLSMVWSGDTQPNQYMTENARGVDLLIHETAPDPTRYSTALNVPMKVAENVIRQSHTPAKALGKILQLTRPRLGVTCHSPIDSQEVDSIIRGVHTFWNGPYQIGEDRMVFNVSKKQIVIRKAGLQDRPWSTAVNQPTSTSPSLDIEKYRTAIFQEKILKVE
jgi:ribonuclease Z